MKEKKELIQYFQITPYCDCGGRLHFSGPIRKEKYEHECENCNKKIFLDYKDNIIVCEKKPVLVRCIP